MFSLFSSPVHTERRITNFENNVTAKKSDLSTTRKPLADRKDTNIPQSQHSIKTKQIFKSKRPVIQEPDYCSYKDIEDNYSDVYFGIGEETIHNILDSFSFYNAKNTPPPQIVIEEPEIMEVDSIPPVEDLTADQISQLFKSSFDMAELPEPSLDFDDVFF